MSKPELPAKTPPRNNYANPHTPIASIKRPRSSIERQGSTNASRLQQQMASPGLAHKTASNSASGSVAASPMPPRSGRQGDEANALSPMHPPKAVHRDPNDHVEEDDTSWVGRKVDALFSPVLSFLSSQEESAQCEDPDPKDTLEHNDTTPTASESSGSPSSGTVSAEDEEEDEVSCGSLQPMEEDHADDDEFNPWQYIKTLPPYAMVSHLCPQVTLPSKPSSSPNITLVLDLDETLVHCTVEPIPDADLTFPVEFHGTTYQVHVRLRPFLKQFFQKIKGQYEVIVFTASQKVYANELLNLIDKDGVYIQHRLFRESCMAVEGNFLKDLNVLGRDLSKTVLVDNSPHAFGFQLDNGIPIESWFDDPNDRELLKLAKFLEKLKNCADVRPIVRERFRCHERVADATPPLNG